jgi:hypothetical protein
MWVPPECKDPIVLHHPTRKSVGYFGAMRLRDGKLLYKRETNSFNAETYWNFMNYEKASANKQPFRASGFGIGR